MQIIYTYIHTHTHVQLIIIRNYLCHSLITRNIPIVCVSYKEEYCKFDYEICLRYYQALLLLIRLFNRICNDHIFKRHNHTAICNSTALFYRKL